MGEHWDPINSSTYLSSLTLAPPSQGTLIDQVVHADNSPWGGGGWGENKPRRVHDSPVVPARCER